MKFHALTPILWTKDLAMTISFYESVLGFSSSSGFNNFATLRRDSVEIMLTSSTDEPDEAEVFTKPIFTGSIYIVTQAVDQLWEFVKDKAPIKTPIGNREYLMRDFSILDNNGYELVFGEDISGVQAG